MEWERSQGQQSLVLSSCPAQLSVDLSEQLEPAAEHAGQGILLRQA